MPKVSEASQQIGETTGYIILAAEIIFYNLLSEKKGINEWDVLKYENGKKQCPACGFLAGYTLNRMRENYPDIYAETMEIIRKRYLINPIVEDYKIAARELAQTLIENAPRSAYIAGRMK